MTHPQTQEQKNQKDYRYQILSVRTAKKKHQPQRKSRWLEREERFKGLVREGEAIRRRMLIWSSWPGTCRHQRLCPLLLPGIERLL